MKRPRGYTLVEMMVVVVLLGLLVAFAAPHVFAVLSDGEQRIAHMQAVALEGNVETWRVMHGRYPAPSEGLTVLWTPPGNGAPPLLRKVATDPWKQQFLYAHPGEQNPGHFDVRSRGADQMAHTADDVGNWDLSEP